MQITSKPPKIDQNKIIAAIEAMPDSNYGSIFTQFEDSIIKKYYSTKGPAAIARVLQKKTNQICSRARVLGVQIRKKQNIQ